MPVSAALWTRPKYDICNDHDHQHHHGHDDDDDDDDDMMICWWSSIMVMMRLMMRWCYDDDLYRLKLVLKVLFGQPLPPNLLIWWLTHWSEGYAEGAICATPPKQFAHRHKTVKIKWRQFRTWEDPGLKNLKLSSQLRPKASNMSNCRHKWGPRPQK